MASNSRGRYNSQTDKQKAKLILKFENLKSSLSIEKFAREHNIGISTFKGWINKRDAILNNSLNVNASKKFRQKKAKHGDLEKELLNDIHKFKAYKMPAVRTWVQTRAITLAQKQGIIGFTASNTWLTQFIDRHGLTFVKACGESAKVDLESIEDWRKEHREKILGYDPANIFNADEFALFYRLLPSKTIEVKGMLYCIILSILTVLIFCRRKMSWRFFE